MARVVIPLTKCRPQPECEVEIGNWVFLSDPLMGYLLMLRMILAVKIQHRSIFHAMWSLKASQPLYEVLNQRHSDFFQRWRKN